MSRDSDKRLDRIILSRETKKLAVCATVEVSVILRRAREDTRPEHIVYHQDINQYNHIILFPYLYFPCRILCPLPEMAVGYRWG